MPLSKINSKSIKDLDVSAIDIANGSITDVKLDTTGVTAAVYGGGTSSQVVVPVITVSDRGRVSLAANQTLSLTSFGGITSTDFSTSGVLIGASITSNSSVTSQSLSSGSLTVTGTSTLQQAKEKVTIAGAAGGSYNFDVLTSAIVYFASNASGNYTLNIRGDSSTTLNSIMSTGQSLTIAILNTNGTTAYYQSALTIDGTAVGITSKWSGAGSPTGGNTSAIDAYVLTIIKTGDATYTVLGSQSKFS